MKISSLASVILLAIAVPVGLAQTNTDDLPAAPSAVKHPQPQPQPQQTAPPEEQKPADPTTPATSATPGGTDKPQGECIRWLNSGNSNQTPAT